jgi:hypothetical protein
MANAMWRAREGEGGGVRTAQPPVHDGLIGRVGGHLSWLRRGNTSPGSTSQNVARGPRSARNGRISPSG